MDEGKDWLETILTKRAYNESPIKVLEIDTGGSGLGKGENFMSNLSKIKAKVLLGSGRTKTISLLVKHEHTDEHLKRLSVEGEMFIKEITMYRDVLPKMQELLEDINDPEGIFWAQYYDVRLYNRICFEDLGASGYKTGERLKQLGLNASLMAVKYFAKFHALSRILLDRREIPMGLFMKNHRTTDPEQVKSMEAVMAAGIRKASRKLASWGGEWKEASERLTASEDLHERFIDAFNPKPDEFTVLCHMDAWTNNMMFKGNVENPTSFRIIDLQVCCLNSPAKDLSQFFVTSVRTEVRQKHTDLLVQTYTDELSSYLLKLGYEGVIPTIEDIKTALDRKALVSLFDAIGFVPIILASSESAQAFEDTMKEVTEAKRRGEGIDFDSWDQLANLTPVAETIIKYQVTEAMKSGLI